MAGKNSVGFKQYNEFVFKQYKLEIVLMQDHLSLGLNKINTQNQGSYVLNKE